MSSKIIEFSLLQKQHEYKKDVVLSFLINYFKDINDTGTVNIPYFIEARNTYNNIIRNNKDLNKYYGKIKGLYAKNNKLFC